MRINYWLPSSATLFVVISFACICSSAEFRDKRNAAYFSYGYSLPFLPPMPRIQYTRPSGYFDNSWTSFTQIPKPCAPLGTFRVAPYIPAPPPIQILRPPGRSLFTPATSPNQNARKGDISDLDSSNSVDNASPDPTADFLANFDFPSDPQLLAKLFNHPEGDFDVAREFGVPGLKLPDFPLLQNVTRFNVTDFRDKIDRKTTFSHFLPDHQGLGKALTDKFKDLSDMRLLLALTASIRGMVNPQMFTYCLLGAVLQREDTRRVNVPSLVSNMPHKFIHRNTLKALGDKARSRQLQGLRCIPQPPTSLPGDVEQIMAYFREDIGLNLHHWYWHLLHPVSPPGNIHKDRRGELFYYMHSQIIARYNFERFSNGLQKAVPLLAVKQPLLEAYFPGIDTSPGTPYSDRAHGAVFTDFRLNETEIIPIELMQLFATRIQASINSHSIYNTNGTVSIPPDEIYMDILGNIVEASDASPSKSYYGDFHNYGHIAIGSSHDPLAMYTTTKGVMMDTATAMRDPLFYRWHSLIDQIFDSYKKTLPPYTPRELGFNGVQIQSVKLETRIQNQIAKNQFLTYMENSYINVFNSTESFTTEPIRACYQHLQHHPFTYKIKVNVNRRVTAVVRIFLAPTYNPDVGGNFHFYNQRNMFIKLDKFVITLNQPTTIISRHSMDSALTTPTEQTFQRVSLTNTTRGEPRNEKVAFSGCGWPEYLLIPRGTPSGLPAKLFVMITDWEDDKVEGSSLSEGDNRASHIFCGIQNEKYPSKRPMGYPFDRLADETVTTVEEFAFHYKNMYVMDAGVRFLG